VLLPLVAFTAGCVGPSAGRSLVPSASTNPVTVVAHAAPASGSPYVIGCPDVLAVSFADRPQADCLAAVDLDGRLPLGDLGRPRVDGLTLDEARTAVARTAAVEPGRVAVSLADPRTGRVTVHGPERNHQREVQYVGPERLAAFLDRTGAFKSGSSDWRDVCVVRPNVAAGEKTQVFRADLEAIVLDGDHTTDVPLRPGDQVYVGETRRSSFSRVLPDWVRPWYRALVGLRQPEAAPR
jgi:protein involved in polysaccharide export with SLBB domain